jgi:acetyl-CoA carboxylase biotin carboxyl carrier protein
VSLTAADVAEIMKILEGSGFDEVLLEIDGLKLSMRRGAGALDGAAPATSATATAPAVSASAPAAARGSATSPPSAASTSASPAAPAPEVQRKATASTDPTVQDVTSPLLGTCYRAPKPGAAPFVEVGTVVSEETVVAIVEVMKLMNTVRAGVKGSVTEILMRDGALVEYGETLLRVKKAG